MPPYSDEPGELKHIDERQTPRIAVITFGIGIQFITGALLFTLPPGGSAVTWLVYIALGVVGLLHILMGAVMWRPSCEVIAPTAAFEGDDIPWHAKRCPSCERELGDLIAVGRRRCPTCHTHFTTRDLGWRSSDPAGEPVTLSPHERRISGRHMVTLMAVLATLLIALAIYAGVAWPAQPGP